METLILVLSGASLLISLIVLICVLLVSQRVSAQGKNDELKRELDAFRQTVLAQDSQLRQELNTNLFTYNESIRNTINDMSQNQQQQLADFSKRINEMSTQNEMRMETMRQTLERHLTQIQEDNTKKLEEMRKTVDDKLSATLEKRLGESFTLVSTRLGEVYQKLGEMRELSSGVMDLKKVLTNVKTRGTWGEISLANLLQQVLSPQQYAQNVIIGKGREIVEFAICLPGADDETIYLPIDSKFPMEDYIRLVDASQAGDAAATDAAAKRVEASIKECAKDIRDKYIVPPYSTNFAIMYLPTEGLYAEATKRVGLMEQLQRDYRVTIMGPATLGAFLNSLQMGFKTLAIQKRTGEIQKLLGAVKTDFSKFADLLEKTNKKLQEASNTITDATKRTQIIARKLRNVEELPQAEASAILDEPLYIPANVEEDEF